jgi:uncharacterized membrane protein YhaH (DUF805 family)
MSLSTLVESPLSLLASPRGTIGRTGFLAGLAMLALAALALDGLARPLTDGFWGFAFALAVAWSAGCLSRKRLHDLGRSGILIIYFLAAYIVAVLAIPCIPDLPARDAILPLVAAGPAIAWLLWLSLARGTSAQAELSVTAAA